MNGLALLLWATTAVHVLAKAAGSGSTRVRRRRLRPNERAALRRALRPDAARHALDEALASERALDALLAAQRLAGGGGRPAPPSGEMLERAQRLAEKVVRLREREAGPFDLSVAKALRKLALVRAARFGPAAAVSPLSRALRVVERARAWHESFVPMLVSDLGMNQLRCGRRRNARRLLEQACALHETDPCRGPDYLVAANRLARIYLEDGDPAAARPVLEKALAHLELAARGVDDVAHAATAFNLALVLQAQADPEGARTLFEKALALEERELGNDHPELVSTLVELAGCVEKLGDVVRARGHLLRAHAILSATHGPDAPDLAAVLGALARLHVACGQPDKGRPLLERLLAIRRRELGSQHPDLVVTLNNLAYLAEAAEDVVEARRWRERALALGEQAWGPDHPNLAPTLESLGALLWAGEHWDDCRTVNERLLRIRMAELGPDHPAIALKLQDLAALEARAGQPVRAADLFACALDALERSPVAQRSVVRKILQNLESLSGDGDEDEDGIDIFALLAERARLLDRRMMTAPPMAEA